MHEDCSAEAKKERRKSILQHPILVTSQSNHKEKERQILATLWWEDVLMVTARDKECAVHQPLLLSVCFFFSWGKAHRIDAERIFERPQQL